AMLPAALEGTLTASMLNENSSHRLRSRREEMVPAIPAVVLVAKQPQIRLMYQGRRLQCVLGAFLCHLRASETAQFLIDNRQQFLCRVWVALSNGIEELRNLGHDSNYKLVFRLLRQEAALA